MRYEGSQHNEKTIMERIFAVVNFVLILVITYCVNYMVAGLLFR